MPLNLISRDNMQPKTLARREYKGKIYVKVRMCLGLQDPDPDPVERVTVLVRIQIQLQIGSGSFSSNSKKNLNSYCFVASLWFFIFKKCCKCSFKKYQNVTDPQHCRIHNNGSFYIIFKGRVPYRKPYRTDKNRVGVPNTMLHLISLLKFTNS
jgi:hypothetical protein